MENKISNKKVIAWKKTLTRDQKAILNKAIQDENQKIFGQEVAYLDSVVSSVLIKILDDTSLSYIKDVSSQISMEMVEERTLTKKIRREFLSEEDYIKYMKELEKEVIKFIEQLFENGLNQKKVREETIIKFSKLSKSQITNAVKRVKENLDNLKNMSENAITQDENIEVEKNEEIKKVEGEDGAMKNEVPTCEVENKKVRKKLKIKKIDIEGEFGSYECIEGYVEFNFNKLKLNRDKWEEFKLEVEEVFEMGE